jgi:hypothetical protein
MLRNVATRDPWRKRKMMLFAAKAIALGTPLLRFCGICLDRMVAVRSLFYTRRDASGISLE